MLERDWSPGLGDGVGDGGLHSVGEGVGAGIRTASGTVSVLGRVGIRTESVSGRVGIRTRRYQDAPVSGRRRGGRYQDGVGDGIRPASETFGDSYFRRRGLVSGLLRLQSKKEKQDCYRSDTYCEPVRNLYQIATDRILIASRVSCRVSGCFCERI